MGIKTLWYNFKQKHKGYNMGLGFNNETYFTSGRGNTDQYSDNKVTMPSSSRTGNHVVDQMNKLNQSQGLVDVSGMFAGAGVSSAAKIANLINKTAVPAKTIKYADIVASQQPKMLQQVKSIPVKPRNINYEKLENMEHIERLAENGKQAFKNPNTSKQFRQNMLIEKENQKMYNMSTPTQTQQDKITDAYFSNLVAKIK